MTQRTEVSNTVWLWTLKLFEGDLEWSAKSIEEEERKAILRWVKLQISNDRYDRVEGKLALYERLANQLHESTQVVKATFMEDTMTHSNGEVQRSELELVWMKSLEFQSLNTLSCYLVVSQLCVDGL